VLVVTTTVWMLYGVLGHTPNLGPAVSLYGIFVVGTPGLEEGLVCTSSTGNNPNLGTNRRLDSLLTSRRETETSGALFIVVGDNDRKGTRAASKGTTVTSLSLNITDDGTLWNNTEGKNVSAGESCLLSTVDELTSVHALSSNHEFSVTLVTVRIEELYLGNRSTTTRIVDDLLDHTTDVAVFLSVVERAKFDGSFAGADVSLEDSSLSLPLCL